MPFHVRFICLQLFARANQRERRKNRRHSYDSQSLFLLCDADELFVVLCFECTILPKYTADPLSKVVQFKSEYLLVSDILNRHLSARRS